jgi:hypothetical protein
MLTRAELEKRLLAMTPAFDGLTEEDGLAVLLTMMEGVAGASDDPQQIWTYVLITARERVDMYDGADDCWGHA